MIEITIPVEPLRSILYDVEGSLKQLILYGGYLSREQVNAELARIRELVYGFAYTQLPFRGEDDE